MRGQVAEIGEEIERRASVVQIENEAALEEAGWYDFPNADRLQADTGFEATREMLATVRSIYEHQKRQQSDLRNDWIAAIRSVDGPPHKIEEYASLVTGFYSDNEVQLGRVQDAYLENILEAESLVDFLARTAQSWTVENGQLLFDSDDDVQTYNQHLQNIRALDAEIAQTLESLQQ
jgi:hypothetical protein